MRVKEKKRIQQNEIKITSAQRGSGDNIHSFKAIFSFWQSVSGLELLQGTVRSVTRHHALHHSPSITLMYSFNRDAWTWSELRNGICVNKGKIQTSLRSLSLVERTCWWYCGKSTKFGVWRTVCKSRLSVSSSGDTGQII